jgi:hypothetical protein
MSRGNQRGAGRGAANPRRAGAPPTGTGLTLNAAFGDQFGDVDLDAALEGAAGGGTYTPATDAGVAEDTDYHMRLAQPSTSPEPSHYNAVDDPRHTYAQSGGGIGIYADYAAMDGDPAAQPVHSIAGGAARVAAANKRRATGKHDPGTVSSGSVWAWRGVFASNVIVGLLAMAALVLSLQCGGGCDSAAVGDLTRTVAGLRTDVVTLQGTVASQASTVASQAKTIKTLQREVSGVAGEDRASEASAPDPGATPQRDGAPPSRTPPFGNTEAPNLGTPTSPSVASFDPSSCGGSLGSCIGSLQRGAARTDGRLAGK